MPFPSWVEGEGENRGQFILLSDSLSISWVSSGRREDHVLEVSAEGVPCPSGVPSSALSSVRGASSQAQGCPSLCGSEEVSRAPSGRELAAAQRVPRAGWSAGVSGSVQAGPRKPNIMPAIWTCILKPGSNPLPHSHPCSVFSPCHQSLR